MTKPILQFDFQSNPMIFSHAHGVIKTNKLTEVESCLQQIEIAVQNGYYVAGYLSYEVTYAFLQGNFELNDNRLPLLWFGIYDEPTTNNDIITEQEPYHIGQWQMKQSKQEYEQTFANIMSAIHTGEIKQVNYTAPFEASFTGNAYRFYERLKAAQNASYSAYLQLDDIDILSVSPELFFQLDGDDVTIKPMKGTIHRGKTYTEDIANRNWLQASEKNQYENKLIIDLMKKELAPLTEPSSIYIPSLYEVEQYPTVYQMTSTIKGTVLPTVSFVDIIKGLFPCGSISGVPKQETLRLIHQIEPFPREIYCGAIGYITPNREAIFNVPIRTVTIDRTNNLATYGAGGAITAHSNMGEEYEEMVTKTKVLTQENETFDLLETIGLIDGKLIVLDEHLRRLQQSAAYFQFPIQIDTIKRKLFNIADQMPTGDWRIRLTLTKLGKPNLTYTKMEKIEKARVALAQEPIDLDNIFHYHKTTNRKIYDEHKTMNQEIFDVLLWNANGELTEFTIGNLVVKLAGELYTPPINCGVLPGTYRKSLLESGTIHEKVLEKPDLDKAARIWLINSVRQWIEVYF